MLIYSGAFAEKNAFEDMLVVLFFGGLGWVMEKLEWPRPPVLLGLVLGPLAENRSVSVERQLRTSMATMPRSVDHIRYHSIGDYLSNPQK